MAPAGHSTTATQPAQAWITLTPADTNSGGSRRVLLQDFEFTGAGEVRWPDGKVQRGHWQAGKLHGLGDETIGNSRYSGQWQAGQRSGPGRQTYADGSVYQGHWQANQRHGQGTFTSAKGVVYQGNWQHDQQTGYGTATYPNHVRYAGMWQAGVKQGFGEETRPDHSAYKGEWADNLPHGQGEERYATGSRHSGTWVDGHILGSGTRTHAAGMSVTGMWTKDVIRHGLVEFADGSTYAGPLFADRGRALAEPFLQWLKDASDSGSADVQFFLGQAYLDFAYPASDATMATHWLQQSAAQGHIFAQYRLAILLQDSDWSQAATLLESAAAQGHAQANALLGQFYATGYHYPQDYSVAVRYFEIAMDGGSIEAANNLAWLLATSTGTWADPQRASEILQPLVMYFNSWQLLDTFAAAHARMQRFELAQTLVRQALEDARNENATGDELAALQERLNLYQGHTAYTE